MKIWTSEERLKKCTKGHHLLNEYSYLIGHVVYAQEPSFWSNKPKAVFEDVYEKRSVCSICRKRFIIDYKLKEIK